MKMLQVDLAPENFQVNGIWNYQNSAVSLDDLFNKQRKNLVYQQFQDGNLN